jgi:WD40 repeat protein
VTGIGFTGDGRYVASSGRDKVVKVYEVNTGTLFTTYNGHNRNIGRYRGQAPVWAVAFPSGSPQILSAGGGTWIQAWEPEKAKLETGDAGDMEERFQTGSHAKHFPHGLQGAVLAVAWAAGTVYAAGEDGVAVAIDAAAGQVRTRFGTPGEWAHAISVDPEGRILAVGRYDGTIALYDAASGVERSRFRATPAVSAVPSKKPSGVARPSVPTRRPIGGRANRSVPRTPLPRQ